MASRSQWVSATIALAAARVLRSGKRAGRSPFAGPTRRFLLALRGAQRGRDYSGRAARASSPVNGGPRRLRPSLSADAPAPTGEFGKAMANRNPFLTLTIEDNPNRASLSSWISRDCPPASTFSKCSRHWHHPVMMTSGLPDTTAGRIYGAIVVGGTGLLPSSGCGIQALGIAGITRPPACLTECSQSAPEDVSWLVYRRGDVEVGPYHRRHHDAVEAYSGIEKKVHTPGSVILMTMPRRIPSAPRRNNAGSTL